MKDLQKYKICCESISNVLDIMNVMWGGSFIGWEDETAKEVYVKLLECWRFLDDKQKEYLLGEDSNERSI